MNTPSIIIAETPLWVWAITGLLMVVSCFFTVWFFKAGKAALVRRRVTLPASVPKLIAYTLILRAILLAASLVVLWGFCNDSLLQFTEVVVEGESVTLRCPLPFRSRRIPRATLSEIKVLEDRHHRNACLVVSTRSGREIRSVYFPTEDGAALKERIEALIR